MGAKGPGLSLNGLRGSCSGPWGSASTQFCPGGCPLFVPMPGHVSGLSADDEDAGQPPALRRSR